MYGNLKTLKGKDTRNFTNYFKEEEDIYVYNNTSPRGTIVITVNSVHSKKASPLKIPKTFIPINLTDTGTTKEDLLHCHDFKKLYQSRHIVLVNPEYAKKIHNSEDGKEELSRLNLWYEGLMAEDPAGDPNMIKEGSKGVVNAEVMRLVERKESGDLDFRSLKKELRQIENSLTEVELAFLTEKFPKSTTIRNYCQSVLTEE